MKKFRIYTDSHQEIIEFLKIMKDNSIISNIHRKVNKDLNTFEYSFLFNNFEMLFNVSGVYSQSKLPDNISKFISLNFKPDIFFCDESDNLIISIEKTDTAPVGNAINQRANRFIYPYENKIPIYYIFPEKGFDASNDNQRVVTGSFNKLYLELKNKLLYSYNNEKELVDIYIKILDILCGISKFDYKFDEIKLKFDKFTSKWTKSIKTKPNNDKCYNLIKNICSTNKSYSIVDGSPFYVVETEKLSFDERNIFPKNIEKKIGIIVIQGFKKNGSYSDPNTGEISLFSFLLKKYGISDIFLYIFSEKAPKKEIFIQNKNKITNLSKQYVDCVILYDGELIFNYEIKKTKKNKSKNKFGEDFVTSYFASMSLFNDNIYLKYIQCPGGGWTMGHKNNNIRRDESRNDLTLEFLNQKITLDFENKEKVKDLFKEKRKEIYSDIFIYAALKNNSKNNDVDIFVESLSENESLILLNYDGTFDIYNNNELLNDLLSY
jgi:hypothetical protein